MYLHMIHTVLYVLAGVVAVVRCQLSTTGSRGMYLFVPTLLMFSQHLS